MRVGYENEPTNEGWYAVLSHSRCEKSVATARTNTAVTTFLRSRLQGPTSTASISSAEWFAYLAQLNEIYFLPAGTDRNPAHVSAATRQEIAGCECEKPLHSFHLEEGALGQILIRPACSYQN
jgi:hypothetical protein